MTPSKSGAPRRVCMLSHSYFENDNRVQRYAKALARRGDAVSVLSLRRRPDMPVVEDLDGVAVYRIHDRFEKRIASPAQHLWGLGGFMVKASAALKQLEFDAQGQGQRRPWHLLHVHNVPDFLVYSTRGVRRRGARVILDIHDLMPEFYADKFKASPDSWAVRSLAWLERASAQQADHVILANHLWLDRYAARCDARLRSSVMINHVDQQIFQRRDSRPLASEAPEQPLILFPGGFERHQGLDLALQAFARLRDQLPMAQFHLYGDGSMKQELQALAAELQLGSSVQFFEPLPLQQMARVMAKADLGVVPKRADGFGNEAFSTKILEFMAVGVPVVASRTRVDQYYFHDGCVQFFNSGDVASLELAMRNVLCDRALQQRLVDGGRACVERLGWSTHEKYYLDLVDRLTAPRPGASALSMTVATTPSSWSDVEAKP